MPVRRLALACLAACSAAPEPPPPAPTPPPAQPTPAASSSPVPEDSPQPPAPRLLHARVAAFTVLGDALLISPRSGDPTRLDPRTGTTTPWSVTWSPRTAGWRVPADEISCGHPQARADGLWLAVACMFEPTPAPRSGRLTSAILVTRADGGEPRCVGIGTTTDEYPPFTWLRDAPRLLGDWSVACTPGPGGRLVPLPGPAKTTTTTRTFDPDTATRTILDVTPDFEERDPQGDLAAIRRERGGESGLDLVDLRTGATLRSLPEAPHEFLWTAGFVAPDAVLVNIHRDHSFATQRLELADGRTFAPPTPTWRHFARLPNDEHLFTRDAGATLEQGRVDWYTFTVTTSRPRPDLLSSMPRFDRTSRTTFTPALGGLLIHDPTTGALHLTSL